MEHGREVKKSFCLLSVAYIVIGLVLVIWPDISVHTFCFVFGIGMIIFGGAHLILYFTKDRFMNVMQPDLVIGVVCISTGCYILLKMEYMLEIIPFAMGIVALLGGIVKIQSALDLKKLGTSKWYIMLIWAIALLILGVILIANPFDEQQKVVVVLTGASLLTDGIGNLISIFWTGIRFRRLKRVPSEPYHAAEQELEIIDLDKKSKIIGSGIFFRKKAAKEEMMKQDSVEEVKDSDEADTTEVGFISEKETEAAYQEADRKKGAESVESETSETPDEE